MPRRSLFAALMSLCLGLLGATALAPATAASDSRATHQAVAKINYPGYGIEIARHSGGQRKLKGTPGSFKRFVKARLDAMFAETGSKPRCAAAPTIVVDRYHGAGWASAGEGWYGDCPGGGYAVIYEQSSSGWHPILGAQDLRFCQDLAWWGVPRFIAGSRCLTEAFTAVRYRTHDETAGSPEATARRAISNLSGIPILPEEHVILPAAQAQLQALADKGGYLAVADCIEAGDGSPLAVHLGDAPFGCVVTATYTKGKKETTESVMFRMRADGDDLLVTELHPFA